MENGYDPSDRCMVLSYFYPSIWLGKALFLHGNLLILLLNKKNVWPIALTRIRTKILLWYIKNIVPMIQSLPNDEQTYSSLTLLEDWLNILAELEYNLLSGERTIISEMLHEVKRQKNRSPLKK
ncbi:hypothetical protein ACLB1R_01585 [Escherichia coli]